MADTYSAFYNEGTTPTYTVTLKDHAENVLTDAIVTSIRGTYYSAPSGTIINSRENQDMHDANNCTLNDAGLFTWKMEEADVLIVEDPKPVFVIHRLVLVIEWDDADDDPRQVTHVIHIPIVRVENAPFDS